jgi:hypothetical protein
VPYTLHNHPPTNTLTTARLVDRLYTMAHREAGLNIKSLGHADHFDLLSTQTPPIESDHPKKSSYPLARGLKTLSGAGLR